MIMGSCRLLIIFFSGNFFFLFSIVVGRKKALAWCVENGFELVELEPEPDSDDEGWFLKDIFLLY